MAEYTVTASLLNLRNTPSAANRGNIVTRLKRDEKVDVRDTTIADWYKVDTLERMPSVSGYASSAFLRQSDGSSPVGLAYGQPVHLEPSSFSKRSYHGAWHFPLLEENMPRLTAATTGRARVAKMHEIIQYLAVDKSARYKKDEHTYCNIYAHDYCYLCGVFLPRVWWMNKALLELKAGKTVGPKYGLTVHELNANALFDWLEGWGNDFNWQRTYDLDDLQEKVNQGRTGIICGPNKNPQKSGHISCVVPETENKIASRQSGKVICPLLSQAGAVNLKYYNNNRWWFLPQIKEFGFWYS